MSHVPTPPRRSRASLRRDAPLWRQGAEGIALVVVIAGIVGGAGFLLAVLVSLLF